MEKYRIELKWALIFTASALAWMVVEKQMGWHGPHIDQHATMTNLFAIVAVALYVFALRDKRRNYYAGTMTWKQGFLSGVIVSVIVALLSPLSQVITHFLISPDYFPNAIAYAVESGNSTQQQAEAYFSLGSYLMQAFVGALIMGVITSAIVAFFVKTRSKG